MIPKIIHYCWFGGSPLPSEYKIYIDEWKALHPDWEIKRWDETNFPVDNSYMANALEGSNWANASNYARLRVMNDYGGIYLDTDVKLLEPLDALLNYKCFLGFEEGEHHSDTFWVNNAVFGAIAKHPFSKKCLDKITVDFDGNERPNESSPKLATQVLIEEYQLKSYGQQVLADDIHLFEKEVFYPIPWNLVKNTLNYKDYTTSATVGVHMWGRTWFTREMMLEMIDDLQYWSNNLEKELSSTKAVVNELTDEKTFLMEEGSQLKKEIDNKNREIQSLQEKNEKLEKLLLERTLISDDYHAKSQQYIADKFLDLETKIAQQQQEGVDILVTNSDQLIQIHSHIEHAQNQIQKLQPVIERQQESFNAVNAEKLALINQLLRQVQELQSLIVRQQESFNTVCSEKQVFIDQLLNQVQELQGLTVRQQESLNIMSSAKQDLLYSYQSEIGERKKTESEWAEQKRELDSKIMQSEILATKLMGDITYYQETIKTLEREYDQKGILKTIKAKIKF